MPSPLKALNSMAVFGSALLNNAGSVGAAVPSSRALADKMASFIPRGSKGIIVELGAGTGAVTEALLAGGIPAERLVPVELSEPMARHLGERFPELRVLRGDASKLRESLKAHFNGTAPQVAHVVSSLPLRSLPKTVVARIAREVAALLPPEGRLIQFTYNLTSSRFRPLARFRRVEASTVWLNVPPARVDVYVRA
jgi:phospholipid N-methyltransferase